MVFAPFGRCGTLTAFAFVRPSAFCTLAALAFVEDDDPSTLQKRAYQSERSERAKATEGSVQQVSEANEHQIRAPAPQPSDSPQQDLVLLLSGDCRVGVWGGCLGERLRLRPTRPPQPCSARRRFSSSCCSSQRGVPPPPSSATGP